MIDKAKFATGMGLLAGAFNRTVDAPVSRMYYGILSASLTTEQFEDAITQAVATETFWPSPAVLLSKVKADADSRALLAFERVNRVLGQHGGYRFLPGDVYRSEFDGPTRQAITCVGGLAAICNTPEERWSGLQRRFVTAYQEALQPKLAAPSTDPRVTQLVQKTARHLTSGRDRAAGVDS